jgi:signal transduction histidine kinase
VPVRSLTLRLALLTALWVVAGLTFTGWFVLGVAERQIEAAADARLMDLMDSVIAAAATDAAGRPHLERSPAGGEFDRPLSGQYWRVTAQGGIASSRSLWDAQLPPPLTRINPSAPLTRDIQGPRNEPLRLLERAVEIPGTIGLLVVQVAASRAATDAEVARLLRGVSLAFGLLGLGLVGGVVAQVVWGLRPLHAASHALSEVRAGKRTSMAVAAPSEIAPLVEEVDALIAQNHATVERARAHVGNLAHALKTPIAVLLNSLRSTNPNLVVALGQAKAIERIMQHHLARARSSARPSPDSLAGRASPLAVAEEVAGALRRLQAERTLTIVVGGDATLSVRANRQDLIEIVGNLMENACKWAASRVEVCIVSGENDRREPGRPSVPMVIVVVEDDGSGLPESEATAETLAMTRGVRLDETMAGSGLGLAIVADLAGLHGGCLTLSRSRRLSGAAAKLELPAAATLQRSRPGSAGSRARRSSM